VTGTSNLVRHALRDGEIATSAGILQRDDARVKLVGAFLLLVAVALAHAPVTLVLVSAAAAVVAAASRVPIVAYVVRAWLVAPLFTVVVAVPATLSIVTPGDVILRAGPLAVTEQGLVAAVTLVLRVVASISIVTLVTVTTPWNDVLDGLRGLRVPRAFVLVVAMAYRYIFHLLDVVDELYVARRARVGRERDPHRSRSFVSGSAGALFGKAHALSEDVHDAMVARGFRADIRSARNRRFARREIAVAVVAVTAALLTIGVDHVVR